ncbi:MAG: hypothetical protein IPO27_07060 [Bacteroidetes bacterium]|nr:hypothetical protein [Bacteroidota bacterium]
MPNENEHIKPENLDLPEDHEELDTDGEISDDTSIEGDEGYPNWTRGIKEPSGRRRVKRRIKVKRKIKVKKKSSNRNTKKLAERIIWIVVIIGFIIALTIMIREMDISDEKYRSKKKSYYEVKGLQELTLLNKGNLI